MSRTEFTRCHRGTVAVLALVLMVALFGMLAFAVDFGVVYAMRTQMQRSADAAALAAAWNLYDQQVADVGNPWLVQSADQARASASQFAGLNVVGKSSPSLADGDVTIGYLSHPASLAPLSPTSPLGFNAAQVSLQRTDSQNGPIPLFFAQVLGWDSIGQEVDAAACYASSFRGFRAPSDGGNLGMLPIALDIETWDAMLQGNGTDDWTWDELDGVVEAGADGIVEVNLYPQGIGLPGNRGTIDIGSSGNSTSDLERQILDGISPDDLAYHGGSLEFDDNGHLPLNGDTGISAALKSPLTEVMGRPSMIPLFDDVSGNGNNADYTIVKFAGVRIMEVKLTGKMQSKRVIVQPAPLQTLGGIPSTGTSYTEYVYSPVVLAR